MPTRILSFDQLCLEADPDYVRELSRPWIYEFSNGRRFYRPPNPYPVLTESATIGTLPPFVEGRPAVVPYTMQYVPDGATIEFWTEPGVVIDGVWDSSNWNDGSVWG